MATTDNLVKVGQLQTVLTRVKSELDTLDGRKYGDATVANGKINFYAKAGDATPLKSIDLPEEIFLDQTQTTFVQSFTWSDLTYPGSTNPNLNGKPVLVLAVKGDKTTNPTLSYSFINLETLVTTYTPGAGIAIANNTISVSVAGATQGNFVLFGADGSIVDSGFTVASDTDITNMLNSVFSVAGGGA